MGLRKTVLAAGTLAAAFSLAACQPPSAQTVESATTALVERAQAGCPNPQNPTLLREIFADAKPGTVTRLNRREMTVCLHPLSPAMTQLPKLSISYYNLGPKMFQLSAEISRDIRAPLLDRVADAGHTTPFEWIGSVLDNFGTPKQQSPTYEQQAAAEGAAMRGTSEEAIILQQIFAPPKR